MRMAIAAALALVVAAPSAAAQERDIAPVVDRMIDTVIVPAHERFADVAGRQAGRVEALCAQPGEAALATARDGFGKLLAAFGAVELYRFGPAREENRLERLFFWPDRRGRGLRQVQGVIAGEDESVLAGAGLKAQSVALQGLPALEFALFGTGSNALADAAGFRCAYAAAVSSAIAEVADELAGLWRGSFRDTLRSPGPRNVAYRSHGEALQDILQAAGEQLAFVTRFKLGPAVGEDPADARPRLAPFWRAGGTLSMVVANLRAVDSLLVEGLDRLLGDEARLAESARFELSRALGVLEPLAESDEPFAALVEDEDTHGQIAYARIPIAGAAELLSVRIPGTLGLVAGFNALDGD